MGNLGKKGLDLKSEHYISLRQKYWRFFNIIIIIFFFIWIVLEFLDPTRHPVASYILLVALVVGLAACILVCLVVRESLMRFRCPHCGARFIPSSSWDRSSEMACLYCGLKLRGGSPLDELD